MLWRLRIHILFFLSRPTFDLIQKSIGKMLAQRLIDLFENYWMHFHKIKTNELLAKKQIISKIRICFDRCLDNFVSKNHLIFSYITSTFTKFHGKWFQKFMESSYMTQAKGLGNENETAIPFCLKQRLTSNLCWLYYLVGSFSKRVAIFEFLKIRNLST